jgi:hypothetical protein
VCNAAGYQQTAADATGTATFDFTVVKGPFGTNNVVCGPSQQCYIAISNVTSNQVQGAMGNISFA